MLKDEVALSKEKIKKLDIIPIIKSVVDDFNNIYKLKEELKFHIKMMEKINILFLVLKIELNK